MTRAGGRVGEPPAQTAPRWYARKPSLAQGRGRKLKAALLNSRRDTVLRVVAHLAAWLPFIAGAVRLIRHGWRPLGDEAVISLRSWSVFTSHAPLVGQATRLAHGVFDPGPLEYWLLAIPVRLDNMHGVLWGGALCCMVAASLAIEAAWSVRGPIGGLGVSAIVLGLVLWLPGVAVPASWNPWFGMMFFLAALAAGWAVLTGRRAWWPVLVVCGSIAAQAHLMFAIPSAILILLGLAVGVADTVRGRPGYRWLIIGVVAGVACWVAPLIQQFTSPHGNLAALLRSSGGSSGVPRTGLGFGLKALTSATEPVPLWWRSAPVIYSTSPYHTISLRAAWFGAAVLVLVAVSMVAAIGPLRSRRLAALAAVTLVLNVGALLTYSSIPVHNTSERTLSYLIVLLLPIGVLSWLVIGSCAVLAVRRARAQARAGAPGQTGQQASGPGQLARWAAAGIAVAAVLAGALSLGSVAEQTATAHNAVTDTGIRPDSLATQQIVRALPGQPIAISVHAADTAMAGRLTLGLIWALTPYGFRAEVLQSRLARELGDRYVYHGQHIPLVDVRVGLGGTTTIRVRKAARAA